MTIFFLTLCLWFKAIETPHFIIYFKSQDSLNALRVARYLEFYKPGVDSVTGGNPKKAYIFIEDVGTVSNGYTDPISNSISLFNYTPETDFHFGATKSWWRMVSVHEYTHLSHLSNVRFPVNYLRVFVGKFFLPNLLYLPTYMHEGITVLQESSLDPYDGRLNEGFFDAYTMYLSSRRKIRPGVYINHLPPDYPYGELPYLIGSEFTEFIFNKFGKSKLNRYYTTIAHLPFTIPFIDVPGFIAFKKPLSTIYRDWKKYLRTELPYTPPQRDCIESGYEIKHLTYTEGKLYYVKNHLKRLSAQYIYSQSELIEFDLQNRKKEILYSGAITLGPKVKGSRVYFGIPEITKGKENISYYGLKYINTIVELLTPGKIKKIVSGRIRAFDFINDTLYFVEESPSGNNVLFKYWEGWREPIVKFDSTTIKEVFVSDTSIYIVTQEELKGYSILAISNTNKLDTLLSVPFAIGSLTCQRDTLYFAANYENKWQIFQLDLSNRKVKIFGEDILGYYPAPSSSILYYTSIKEDGEIIKYTLKNNISEEFYMDSLNPDIKVLEVPAPKFTYKGFNFKHLTEAFWHDLFYPELQIDTSLKVKIKGFSLIGHTPLNLSEYNSTIRLDSVQKSCLTLYYNGIPATSVALQISPTLKLWELGLARILKIKTTGYLRQWNGYFEAMPLIPYLSLGSLFETSIYPDIQQQISISLLMSPDFNINASISNYIPIQKHAIASIQLYGEYNLPSKEYLGESNFRLTLPLLKINWGNDAIIHFFYERNFLTLEGYLKYGTQDSVSTKAAILTLDHLFSLGSGSLKFNLRTGIMGNLNTKRIGIVIRIERASLKFSQGIFKKRQLIRELTTKENLL